MWGEGLEEVEEELQREENRLKSLSEVPPRGSVDQ